MKKFIKKVIGKLTPKKIQPEPPKAPEEEVNTSAPLYKYRTYK
jgi:hypothetical protein